MEARSAVEDRDGEEEEAAETAHRFSQHGHLSAARAGEETSVAQRVPQGRENVDQYQKGRREAHWWFVSTKG